MEVDIDKLFTEQMIRKGRNVGILEIDLDSQKEGESVYLLLII